MSEGGSLICTNALLDNFILLQCYTFIFIVISQLFSWKQPHLYTKFTGVEFKLLALPVHCIVFYIKHIDYYRIQYKLSTDCDCFLVWGLPPLFQMWTKHESSRSMNNKKQWKCNLYQTFLTEGHFLFSHCLWHVDNCWRLLQTPTAEAWPTASPPPSKADHSFCQNSSEAAASSWECRPAKSGSWRST